MYDDSTHTGDGVYDGMDPSGSFSLSPESYVVESQLIIESDIHKEYDCSDHFFVISSTSSFGAWSWEDEADRLKVVWNCDTFNIYSTVGSPSVPSSSIGTHHLIIAYTPSSLSIKTDVDSAELSISGEFWSEVWLWMGADDDESRGSYFENTLINYGDCDINGNLSKSVSY